MAIFRWDGNFDPLAGLRYVQRELERLGRPWQLESRRIGGGAYPPVNVYSSEREILVQCELAGVEPREVEVTITGETLSIRGVKPAVAETEGRNFIRRERGQGRFTRTIVLPDAVDAEKIDANLKDGVLTVRLPKSVAAEAKRIEVKPGQ